MIENMMFRDNGFNHQTSVHQLKALLGPIVEHYLRRLDAHIRYLDDGRTCFLFMTRAGVRIMDCYRQYLARLDREIPSSAKLFWSSRLLICKGISRILPTLAIETIGREFAYSPLEETIKAIMPSLRDDAGSKIRLNRHIPNQPLHEFVTTDHEVAVILRNYLQSQGRLFEEYLRATIGNARRLVVVDSGWTGTCQMLLARAFPEFEWIGLYFGWMNSAWDAEQCGPAKGLVFNAESYNPKCPETAIALHRHLFESLFEPNAPSIEELGRDVRNETIIAHGGDKVLHERFNSASDPQYCAVLDHLTGCNPANISEGIVSYRSSMVDLARRLTEPSVEDVYMLAGKSRSADFGRSLQVPVVITKGDRRPGDTPQQRIEKALWPEGQIALEYEPEQATLRQRRRHAKSHNANASLKPVRLRARANYGRVAIITRTKDRPILLARAAESVAQQTFKDYVWVVVNDGGDPDVVKEIIVNSRVPVHQVVMCSNEISVGMEAASNIGIRESKSDYIVIHDDDDTWHPEFLKKTIDYLDSEIGVRYGGVITHSAYVSEEINGTNIIEWGRWPYHDWVRNIQLSELVVENIFPPIAFLFRRSICEEIGLFDESLPVLGDWDFAIRFLLKADIGVLPEQLAYYHHRDKTPSGSYANSVVGGVAKHIEYNAIVRNNFIRRASRVPDWLPVASLMAQGYKHLDLRNRLRNQQIQSLAATPEQQLSKFATYDAVEQADNNWCLFVVTKTYYRGVMGVVRRFMPSPSMEKLERLVQKCPLIPPPNFDDSAYLARYPDVAQAVRARKFVSGFEHYIKYGRREGRARPSVSHKPQVQ